MICLGHPSIGAGPLNAICALPEDFEWEASGLAVGNQAEVDGGALRVEQHWELSFAEARGWRPSYPTRRDRAVLVQGLAALAAELRGRAPADGFGPLLPMLAETPDRPPTDMALASPVVRQALAGIVAVSGWLRAATSGERAEVPPQTETLIGLGPGLTPSGDDLIGGVLIALRALGQDDVAARLAGWILPRAQAGTHAISLAHLTWAAQGEGMAALHETLIALCSPGAARLSSALGRLGTIGHTSGWDALAGALVTLRAMAGGVR
jgi:hypothetical protein